MQYEDYNEYTSVSIARSKTVAEKVSEFHEAFGAQTFDNILIKDSSEYDAKFGVEKLATKLIEEEFVEFYEAIDPEHVLKELADLVYVCYGYADRWGWNLDEAITRVHLSNMSKLGHDGKPILREDGKILKGSNYKEAVLEDLV